VNTIFYPSPVIISPDKQPCQQKALRDSVGLWVVATATEGLPPELLNTGCEFRSLAHGELDGELSAPKGLCCLDPRRHDPRPPSPRGATGCRGTRGSSRPYAPCGSGSGTAAPVQRTRPKGPAGRMRWISFSRFVQFEHHPF